MIRTLKQAEPEFAERLRPAVDTLIVMVLFGLSLVLQGAHLAATR
jgi:hypothetical protein